MEPEKYKKMVDVVGGTGTLEDWVKDFLGEIVIRDPSRIIFDLRKSERHPGKYEGAIYIPTEEFRDG